MTQLTIHDAAAPVRNDLERAYRAWRVDHPKVFPLFERFALEMLAKKRRFGVKLLAERVRWEVRTNYDHQRDEYKLNNNFTAYIARDLIAAIPDLADMLETRSIRDERDDNEGAENLVR